MAFSRLVRPASAIARPAALVGSILFVSALVPPTSAQAAEPTSCLSPDPSVWPAASKPYFMLLVDSSGSMITQVPPSPAAPIPPSCSGYAATRMGHAKCAVKNTALAFSGEVNFGLAQYASYMTGCGSSCYGNATNSPLPGCDLQCFDAETNEPTKHCRWCGTYDNINDPTTAHGANVLVGMQVDNFWTSPPTVSSIPPILQYVDNNCTNNIEVANVPTDGPAFGLTPINGALRDMKRYFQTGWINPDNAAITFPTPLNVNDRPCRSVNIILLTDGDETCDTQPDAVNAAAALFTQGVTIGANNFKIKVHVINFAGGSQTNTDQIAAAGGTGTSYFATNEVQLSQALANIVSGAIKPETCDNTDNNCNGCTDEGFTHYCNVQPVAANCCAWTTAAARTTCLNNYTASITASNPKGNLALLPCTTAAQVQPATWLCFDPGEKCDNTDNNCQSGIDEGISKCGSPAHCPQTETCNGEDDNCNGLIDEGLGATCSCKKTPEICDGCDNDCDGLIDEGITAIPCGQAPPANCAGTISCKTISGTFPPGTCVSGGGFNACSSVPQTESCDGLDNNCNGIVDDGIAPVACVPAGTPGGLVFGGNSQCQKGTQACNGPCIGFIGPSAEICDGKDNDCDGTVDEGASGVGQPCGVNQAPCTPGLTACVGGALVCQGGVQPKTEICDGKDNDCDGQVDETPLADAPGPGMNGCWDLTGTCCKFPLVNPTVTWCPPPGATCNDNGSLTPPCNKGTLTCTGIAGWKCQGAKDPTTEVCDSLDNNCNGKADDGTLPEVGKPCGTSVGECNPGVLQCTAGVLDCVGDIPPSPELCDGKDNDCDGTVDNGISTGGSCMPSYDQGAYPGDRSFPPCQPGILQCNGMGGTTCLGGVGPSPELCDGIDNDCDGQVDEAGGAPDGINGSQNPLPPPINKIGDACGEDVGECKKGAYACVGGVFACLGSQVKGPEQCDCLDNDCNGTIDNPNGPAGPPLCGADKTCVKSGNQCQCANPCNPGKEFPCPTGQNCVDVVSSETGQSLGTYCIADPCANCASATVKDAKGDVLCAPAGTMLPNCVTPPACVCKGQNGCQEPCLGVTCLDGQVCANFGPNAGQCMVDNCYSNPCQGCGKACNLGACVDNPCKPDSCPADQACKPSADFTMPVCVASCSSVTCPSGKGCVDGSCVDTCSPACSSTEACDTAQSPPACVTDKCQSNPCTDGSCCDPVTGACGNCPCEGVICPDGTACQDGQCQGGDGAGAGGGSMSGTGGTGGAGGADSSIWGLATGGGGCACETAPASRSIRDGQLLLLVAAAVLAQRRRRARRVAADKQEVA
jgi:hypothetical protein